MALRRHRTEVIQQRLRIVQPWVRAIDAHGKVPPPERVAIDVDFVAGHVLVLVVRINGAHLPYPASCVGAASAATLALVKAVRRMQSHVP